MVNNDAGGDPSFLPLAKEAVSSPVSSLVDVLIARKRTQFGDDKFLIGVCEVRDKTVWFRYSLCGCAGGVRR